MLSADRIERSPGEKMAYFSSYMLVVSCLNEDISSVYEISPNCEPERIRKQLLLENMKQLLLCFSSSNKTYPTVSTRI